MRDYSRRTVVADVAEVGYSSRAALAVALGPAAADEVCRRPDHLRVVADSAEIVLRGAVREEPLLREPRLDGEEPAHKVRNHLCSVVTGNYNSLPA